VLANVPAGIAVVLGPDLRFALVNPAYQSIAPERTFLGRTVAEAWPDLADQVVPLLRKVAATGVPFHAGDMPFLVDRPGGGSEERFFSFTYLAMPWGGAGEAAILVAVVETTERVRAVRGIAEREAQLRAILEGAQDGFLRSDGAGRIVMASHSAARLYGFPSAEDMVGLAEDALHDDPADRRAVAARVLEGGHVHDHVGKARRRDGTVFWASVNAQAWRDGSGAIHGVESFVRDVTERRAMETQLAVNARLAALGTLVAGVGHEINNPLAGELAALSLASDDVRELRALLRDEAPLDRAALLRRTEAALTGLADAREGAGRIASIVKDLTLFGKTSPSRKRLRLVDVVERAMRWIPASVGSAMTVRVRNDGAPDVLASEGQLQQVVVNLVSNAAHAVPAGRRGEISIRIGPVEPDGAFLEVMDNGAGIEADVMQRIFDPFFTTREVGKGMGLGLPVCHAIVSAHGGTLRAVSAPGIGSTFRMELPAAVEGMPEPDPR
jgi:PAS domain S-box-containing protein